MPAIETVAYLITLTNDKNFAATVYPNRAAANVALETVPAEVGGWIIQTEEDVLSLLTGKLLVDVFNGLTNTGLSKFENRTIGAKRLMSVLPQVAIQPKPAQEKKTMPDDAPETNTTETGGKKGRKPVNASHESRPEWKKIRPGSMRARIAKAMFDGFTTVQAIADSADVAADRVLPHIYATHKDCGIGYHVENEQYKLDRPSGVTTFEQLLQEEKPAEASPAVAE